MEALGLDLDRERKQIVHEVDPAHPVLPAPEVDLTPQGPLTRTFEDLLEPVSVLLSGGW